ncbi:hypothetical protein [Flavobacterium sp. ACAM 123]|jgi:hypothetical protein|nr:hypothetical protein [Flavobacterium sp. ACAM 123]
MLKIRVNFKNGCLPEKTDYLSIVKEADERISSRKGTTIHEVENEIENG